MISISQLKWLVILNEKFMKICTNSIYRHIKYDMSHIEDVVGLIHYENERKKSVLCWRAQ